MILDIMLPGRDGLQILATVRKRGLRTPVLILTARDAIEDRVQGLDQGADDYLVKPFAFPELLARVRALTRGGWADQSSKLQLADLEMDLTGRKARRSGKDLELTVREFEVLEYFLRHKRGGGFARDAGARSLEGNIPYCPPRQRHGHSHQPLAPQGR